MTGKRFHVYEDKKVKFERSDRYGVHDGKIIFKPFLDLEEAEKYCNLLNELNNENEKLKQQIELMKKALRESLECEGNAYEIELMDKIFDLNYDEWYNPTGHNSEPYVDWEKMLNGDGVDD